MMRKKEVFTTITPIPGFIPRQLAIDILHSHSEVITLNPLVIDHRPISAPRDAASDEYYSTWYEVTEKMQFMPGIGRMGSGKIKFNGCFHDMPWGLQTHTYAPMNIDIRIKYIIAGNQPGVEPPAQSELGLSELGVPKDGLYLREDIEIRCNVTIVKYVKEQLKTASKEMVARIIKKAELLDAGVLQGMIEDGRIRTINPNDRSATMATTNAASISGPNNLTAGGGGVRSPSFPPHGWGSSSSPDPQQQQQQQQQQQGQYPNPPMSPTTPYQVPRPVSYMGTTQQPGGSIRPGTSGSQSQGRQQQQHQHHHSSPPQPQYAQQQQYGAQTFELSHDQAHQTSFVAELPGNFYHPQHSPGLHPPPQPSPTGSQQGGPGGPGGGGGGSSSAGHLSPSLQGSSRPTSMTSESSAPGGGGGPGSGPVSGFTSPGLDAKGFASELATHPETQEEHLAHQQRHQSYPSQQYPPGQDLRFSGQSQAQRPGHQSLPSQQQGGPPAGEFAKQGAYNPYNYRPADYAQMR